MEFSTLPAGEPSFWEGPLKGGTPGCHPVQVEETGVGSRRGAADSQYCPGAALNQLGKHEIHAWAMYVCVRQREMEGERTLILF